MDALCPGGHRPATHVGMRAVAHAHTVPLQDRVLPCLFAMLETAHSNLWSYNMRAAPPLTCLLPELDVMLCDL